MKIAHLVNIFTIEERHKASYLHVAMPVTLSAMYNSREYLHLRKMDIEVKLYAVSHFEDDVECPEGFEMTSPLTSLYDNKLPYIYDIFSKFREIDADYYIYSNIDITPERHFYYEIFSNELHDSYSILRHDVPRNYWITREGKKQDHPGHDCFIFTKSIMEKINLPKEVFVGFPPVGNCIFSELKRLSRKHRVHKLKHLTYHLGNDRNWDNHPLTAINYLNNITSPRKFANDAS